MRSAFLACCVLALAACGGDDDTADDDVGDDDDEATWSLLAEGEPGALLSVWGSAEDDVWVVGGRTGAEEGPTVLHYDGTAWQPMDAGVDVDLWWVFGFDGGPVFFGGSGGTILRYQGGVFEPAFTTPGTSRVFGMWGPEPDDVWAVGGNGTGGGFAWHFDGAEWTAVDVPTDLADEGTLFKVAGRATDDFWVSCSGGTMLHWNGASFERTDLDADVLFSVATHDDVMIAVGESRSEGIIFEHAAGEWTAMPPIEGAPPWRGVAAVGQRAYAVGEFGVVLRREASGAWVSDPPGLTSDDLHAAWIDPAGGLFVVGGQFDQPVTEDGVLLHKGGAVAQVNP